MGEKWLEVILTFYRSVIIQWFSFLRASALCGLRQVLSHPDLVMGQCQHLHLTGLLVGVSEDSTKFCTYTRAFHFNSSAEDDDDLC